METLKNLLLQRELTVSDAQISSACEELGVDEAKLTTEQSAIVADYLAKSIPSTNGKLAKTSKSGGKLSTTGSRKTKTNRTPTTSTAGTAIANAFAQTTSEIAEFKEGVLNARDRFAESEAQQLMDEVAETPNIFLQRFAQIAGEHQGDTAFFRAAGESFGSALFRIGDSDEAKHLA